MFYEPKNGHPFKIDPYKALVFPRPIGWISSLSKKGIVDFGKNLLRVGEEFAAQKPIQMAAGRTLGGLEAIQEGLSQFGTAAAADTSKLKPLKAQFGRPSIK